VALGNPRAFVVGGLLVRLVVAVIGVDDIAELANLVLEVDGADFDVGEVCTCRHVRSMGCSLGREDVGIWRELRCGVGNQVSLVLPFSWSRSLSLKFGILMIF